MDKLKPIEQRNEPSTAELVKNARYCCGDIECEGEKECGDYCLDGRDDRNGDWRWCRQWLVRDLADRLESQERELLQKTQELESAKARHARKDAESAELYEKAIARAERAEAERDAADNDSYDLYKRFESISDEMRKESPSCKLCENFPEKCSFCSKYSAFELRGLRGKSQEGEKE